LYVLNSIGREVSHPATQSHKRKSSFASLRLRNKKAL
jgi:hypothetical protein